MVEARTNQEVHANARFRISNLAEAIPFRSLRAGSSLACHQPIAWSIKKMKNMKSTIKTAFTVVALSMGLQTASVAYTLDVTVNSNWEIVSTSTGNAWANQTDLFAGGYRYFTCGSFDYVVIRNQSSTILQAFAANNIFYIVRISSTAYSCSYNYNGSGNGVNGEVTSMAVADNNDVYIGGNFTTAGGYSNTSYFSCYRYGEGWSGVSGVRVDARVETLTWLQDYRLEVYGSGITTLYGPSYSGGSNTTQSVTDIGYWNDKFQTFPDGWWDTQ